MLIVCHSSFRCFWLPLVLFQQIADNVSLKTLVRVFRAAACVGRPGVVKKSLAVQVGPINIFDRPAAVP